MLDPFILMCAPNGARRTKADHPALPITSSDLADCAEQILEAGASIIHLHVRDDMGAHSLDVDRYKAAIEAIDKRVGDKLIVQITTEAVGRYSRVEQMATVKNVRPEAASIALREICPTQAEEKETGDFFAWMQEEGVFPQVILYDQGDVARFLHMRADGVFAARTPFVLCVLGRHGADGEKPEEALRHFSGSLSDAAVPWAICGFGKSENQLARKAAELGGHVRVGFENNLWRADGSPVAHNGELVSAAGEAVLGVGRSLASADDVRHIFSLRR